MTRRPGIDLSPEARALLRGVPGPRPRTAAERARTTARITFLASAPASAGTLSLLSGWKGVTAVLLVAAAAATGHAIRHREFPRSLDSVPQRAARTMPVSAEARPSPIPTVIPLLPTTELPTPTEPAPETAPLPARTAPPTIHAPARVMATARAPTVTAPATVAAASPSRTVTASSIEAPMPIVAAPAALTSGTGGEGTGTTGVGPGVTFGVTHPGPRAEGDMLETALHVLSHDPAAALAEVNAMALAWPAGVYAPERECVALQALEHLGRETDARMRSQDFLTRFPDHLCATRARRIVERGGR